MISKRFDIQDARELTGWAYSEMKWLSEAEAKSANRKRGKLLQSLSGSVNSHWEGNKICSGHLSPGCMICGQGTWSCLFIGSLCTANCFYCPQDRDARENEPPTESGLLFDNPDDYVDYLEKFKFKGVGISGGEPFLQFDKILLYLRKIRERLGRGIYLWVYTNGDLVNNHNLNLLKEAGLNEIRFDIAARKYNLKAVELSVGIMDKVTIEIPAIPEDYEIVKRCLPKMKAMGVAHLNLHQLHASPHCYQNFIARGYTFLHQHDPAILESEITALRLLQYAQSHNVGLAINYCSAIYKHRLQKKGYRERLQSFIKERYEGATESGFIRRLAVQSAPVNINKLVKVFQQKKSLDHLWSYNKNRNNKVLVHHTLLKFIDFNKCDLILAYFVPHLAEVCDDEDDRSEIIELNSKRNVSILKKLVYQKTIKNPMTVKSFQELFIEKKNPRDVFRSFYQNYELKTKADVTEMITEKDWLDYLKTFELIGSGLAEIY